MEGYREVGGGGYRGREFCMQHFKCIQSNLHYIAPLCYLCFVTSLYVRAVFSHKSECMGRV